MGSNWDLGEVPYVIRKCNSCGQWHIFKMEVNGNWITPIIIFTAENFQDILVVINFSVKRLLNKLFGNYGQDGK